MSLKNETNALSLLKQAIAYCPAPIQAQIRRLLADNRIPMTLRQRECLEGIKRLRDNGNGVMPTFEEIGTYLGISKVSAWEAFVALERKGFVARDGHKARSIVIL